MPKKSKSQTEIESPASADADIVAPTPIKAKPAAKKRAAKTTSASRKAPAKKKPAPKAATPKPAASGAAKTVEANEPSDAEIRIRAYFIAERRAQLSLHGDPALDWIEARQQLLQEARQPKP